MNKAHEYSLVRKQSVGSSPVSATLTHCVASRSTSKSAKLPRLEPNADITSTLAKYPERKIGPRALHTRVTNKDKVKGRCVYCSLLYYEKKRAGEDVKWDEEVAQTVKVCGFCSYERESSNCCFLCKKHFDIFHDTPWSTYRSKATDVYSCVIIFICLCKDFKLVFHSNNFCQLIFQFLL